MVDVLESKSDKEKDLVEKVIHVNRVDKVVKGGRSFSFSALVVVGDENGRVGLGYGKAGEVANAIRKSIERAKKTMFYVPMVNGTLPHETIAEFKAARILMKPASRGTGVIAGGATRAILEAAGVQDVLTKSVGSDNALNIAKATVFALQNMLDADNVARLRGKDVNELAAPRAD